MPGTCVTFAVAPCKDCLYNQPWNLSEAVWRGAGRVHFSNHYIYVHNITIKLASMKQPLVWPSVYSHHSWMSCVLGNKEHKAGTWLPGIRLSVSIHLSHVHHYTCFFWSQTCTLSPLPFNSTEIVIIYAIRPCPFFPCHKTEFPGACGGGMRVLKNTFWVTAWEVFIVFFSPSDSGNESIMGIEQANT